MRHFCDLKPEASPCIRSMSFFETASDMEHAPEEKVAEFKEFLQTLVGYACKVACKPNHGSIDLYIFSEEKKAITDWIELQPSGAIGVIFSNYADEDAEEVGDLDDACEEYNNKQGFIFCESDDEDEESDDSE